MGRGPLASAGRTVAVAAVCAALSVSAAGWAQAGAATQRLTILGGPAAGIFNVFATGLSTYLPKAVPGVEVYVAATGGSVENVRRVNSRDAEMGVSFAGDVHEGYYGLEAFQGNPQTNIRALGLLFVGVGHLVTYRDSGIRSVTDLAGKRVAVGSPGSGTFATAERIFRQLGIWDRIQRIPLLGSAAAQALRDGRAEAYFYTAPYPDRSVIEAATGREVQLIELYEPLARTDFFRVFPYYVRYRFAAGAYAGTQPVSTVGIPGLWIAHRDVPAQVIQALVAAAYSADGHAYMTSVHAASADMTPENALSGVTIPLHPGAEAHWRSVGVQIPEGARAR